MRTEIIEILQKKYPEYCMQHIDTADEILRLFSVRLSLPDSENVDYLRGFIDGYGGEEPHNVMPDGFKDINEVWDKMYELKGNEA